MEDYRRSYRHFLRPEFGPMVADEINELEWQMWVDRLGREGSHAPAMAVKLTSSKVAI